MHGQPALQSERDRPARGSRGFTAAAGHTGLTLGTGETKYQRSFTDLGRFHPDKTGIFLSYDYALSHKIFAGSDIVLVPSRYEPCGLNQLYALKYGTVPIVRATGGLMDTVEEYDRQADSGTGFLFVEKDSWALEATIGKALTVFREDPDAWKRLMIRCMNRDFSWARSAEAYRRLYEKAFENGKKDPQGEPAAVVSSGERARGISLRNVSCLWHQGHHFLNAVAYSGRYVLRIATPSPVRPAQALRIGRGQDRSAGTELPAYPVSVPTGRRGITPSLSRLFPPLVVS